MLHQNGPIEQNNAQSNVEVIDITPRGQCFYCGCLTLQCRCPECGAALHSPGHAPVVRRQAVVGFVPSPLKLYAVDKRVGEEWRPVTHALEVDEATAARTAMNSFNLPEDTELRVTPMMGGVPISWRKVPLVNLPAENEAVEVGDEGVMASE